MIEFMRFPHVGEIINHYANSLNDKEILSLINTGVKTRDDAYAFSKFVLRVIDCMASDMQKEVVVLGNIDNTSMIPDIDYEVSLYLARKGMEDIWDEVCNE
jgi:hypothetical protein